MYLIDYGLAKRFRDPKTKVHNTFKQGKKITGTVRYASLSTHLGYEQSRRDDLECLGYSLIYCARGELPWQGVECKSKAEKYEKIREMKSGITIDELCKGLPLEFSRYMHYVKTLQFVDKPDYAQLKLQFQECLRKNYASNAFMLDWIIINADFEANLPEKSDTESSGKAELGLLEDASKFALLSKNEDANSQKDVAIPKPLIKKHSKLFEVATYTRAE